MVRLCERPGCSEPASVAYGMRPEDLVFWLDHLRPEHGDDPGVLCRRHADSMVVPRNWTLDDLRDPDLHLFRPPEPVPRSRSAPRRPTVVTDERPAQLPLDDREPSGDVPDAPWTPAFDDDDDLDGVLAARSPLLARAFRGTERPRRPS